jgi:hypothetical protein
MPLSRSRRLYNLRDRPISNIQDTRSFLKPYRQSRLQASALVVHLFERFRPTCVCTFLWVLRLVSELSPAVRRLLTRLSSIQDIGECLVPHGVHTVTSPLQLASNWAPDGISTTTVTMRLTMLPVQETIVHVLLVTHPISLGLSRRAARGATIAQCGYERDRYFEGQFSLSCFSS